MCVRQTWWTDLAGRVFCRQRYEWSSRVSLVLFCDQMSGGIRAIGQFGTSWGSSRFCCWGVASLGMWGCLSSGHRVGWWAWPLLAVGLECSLGDGQTGCGAWLPCLRSRGTTFLLFRDRAALRETRTQLLFPTWSRPSPRGGSLWRSCPGLELSGDWLIVGWWLAGGRSSAWFPSPSSVSAGDLLRQGIRQERLPCPKLAYGSLWVCSALQSSMPQFRRLGSLRASPEWTSTKGGRVRWCRPVSGSI